MEIPPLETLFEQETGELLPLSGELARIFGQLRLPLRREPAYVIGNFVSTLDGVTALNVEGHMSGGDISGFNPQDQALMGLSRAVADAVIIGAGTMNVELQHLLTSEDIAPELNPDYRELRRTLGKPEVPWNVIVTAHGRLDLELPKFQAGKVPVLIVTTGQGLARLRKQKWGPSTQVVAVQKEGQIAAKTILATVHRICRGNIWLVEGGPRLLGDFLAENCLDELFFTLAPQIAGRDEQTIRPGLVTGKVFAPRDPRWGKLIAIRRGGDHLFLRYRLKQGPEDANGAQK